MRRLPRQLPRRGKALILLLVAVALAEPDAARGAVVAREGGCEDCHTVDGGDAYAGGYELDTKFGTFFAPNITSDAAGVGAFRYDDFVRAMREGRRPDGKAYYPAFPYTSYALMTDEDLADLWAFLRAVPASSTPSRPQEPRPRGRWLLRWWQAFEFHRPAPVDPSSSADDLRGAYLVNGPAHCGECHTPRNALGGLRRRRDLAGSTAPPEPAPPITREALRDWSVDDVETLLQTGVKPYGDSVGHGMRVVVRKSTSLLPDDDIRAMATYLVGS